MRALQQLVVLSQTTEEAASKPKPLHLLLRGLFTYATPVD
jgi:hypothetical protein